MLRREILGEEEEQAKLLADTLTALTSEEAGYLHTIVEELSRPEARDPKLGTVRYFLTEHRTEGKTWLEHGCIIFSQYYDTVYWVGSELAKMLPGKPTEAPSGWRRRAFAFQGLRVRCCPCHRACARLFAGRRT